MPNVIDLFAGAGGLSLGAARAGFNVTAAVEIDTHAIASHKVNFPNTAHIQQDIMQLDGPTLLKYAGLQRHELTGIIGGPPCQGFSSIGHGNVSDIRNRLFVKFFQIIKELQPLFFVAENVPGIMNAKYDAIRDEAFQHVKNYHLLPPICIKANEYGAPTVRTRYFFIGYLDDPRIGPFTVDDIVEMQVPEELRTNVKAALEGIQGDIRYRNKNSSGLRTLLQSYCDPNTHRTQSDFFYQRVTGMIPNGIGDEAYIKLYQKKRIVNGCYPTKHAPEIRMRYAKLAPGQQDKISKSTRLNPDGFCPTLRAGTGPEKGSYQAVRPIHYHYARVITPREAARLQGFPDDYEFIGTQADQYKMIGNAVPPIFSKVLGDAVYELLFKE